MCVHVRTGGLSNVCACPRFSPPPFHTVLCAPEHELTAPRGHAFHSNQDLLRMQKGGVLRNRNDQGALRYPSLPVLIPVINQTLTMERGLRREGEDSFLFLLLLPYSSISQRQSVWAECTLLKGRQTAELVLCSVSAVLSTMQYMCV